MDDQGPDTVANQESTQGLKPDSVSDPNKLKPNAMKRQAKRWWLVVLIVLVLAGLIGGSWYILRSDPKTPENSNTASEQPTAFADTSTDKSQPVSLIAADKIVYAYGEAYDKPASLYYRSTTGGERQSLLDTDELRDFSYSRRAQVSKATAFIKNDTELWVLKDAPASADNPQRIYVAPSGGGLKGAAISADGQKVAFALIPSLEQLYSESVEIDIYVVNSDGQNPHKIATSPKEAPFRFEPEYWINNSFIALTPGAPDTDAPPPLPRILNASSGEVKTLDIDIGSTSYALSARPVISADGKSAVYVLSTVDESDPVEGLIGYYVGPPYKVYVKNLSSGETTQIASVGQKSDYNHQTPKVGWLVQKDGTERAYYTNRNQLFVRKSGGGFDKYFESGLGEISSVLFATEDELLIGTATPEFGQIITHFDVKASKAVRVMETTSDTRIYGVLVK